MIVATAGHVDHGKTALVKALTGVDTDRLPQEKARGISIDLGFAYATTPGGATLGFVDVPGHERFVRNMVAGVCGIDYVLLLVAADDGVMPQTREHLAIVDLLAVAQGIVDLMPDAGLAPAVILGGDRAPGREVVGQLAPLAAGPQDVQDRVQHVPHPRRAGPPAARGFRQPRPDQPPLLVAHVARITLGPHLPFYANGTLWDRL